MAAKKTLVMISAATLLVLMIAGNAVAAPEKKDDEAGCLKVVGPLQPCLDFLRGQGDTPSKSCCDGAKELAANAKTTKDKQEACKCLKDAMSKVKNIDVSRIPQIPEKCNIQSDLPPIGPDFDCATIKNNEFGSGMLLDSY